jgi:hypothetical protein
MSRIKIVLPFILILCLLLCGCETTPAPSATTTIPTTVPVTTPPHVTGYYFTSIDVNFGGYFVTTVTVHYEKDAFTQTYTSDGTTYQNTYDYHGRLLRRRMDGEAFWSEEVITYTSLSDKPLTETYSREGFSSTVTRTFDEKGNALTVHYEATDGSWNTYTYTYNEKGNMLTEKYISSGGSDTLLTNTYDNNGNLISAITLNKGEKTREVTHKYDEKGRLIQDYVWRWEKSKDLITASTTDFTYDSYGNIATQYQVDLNGYWSKTESTYTSDGKLLTDKRQDSDGNTFERNNTYDEKGNLIVTVEGHNGENYRYEYEYSSAGQPLKRTVIDPAGNTTETTQSVYDRNGNRLEQLTTYADGSTEKDVRTYDGAGNLLTYTAYYNDTVSSQCAYTYGSTLIDWDHKAPLESLMAQTFVEFLP